MIYDIAGDFYHFFLMIYLKTRLVCNVHGFVCDFETEPLSLSTVLQLNSSFQ